jgi:basic membrane protein A
MAYQGLLQAETDFGVVGTVYTPTGTEDYANQLQQCVVDGNELCITVGFLFMDATYNAALSYPLVNFAIVDIIPEIYTDNLRGINFDSAQAGYLAGTLAGLMTESDVIGGIGGMDIDPVNAFLLPYGYGASCVNPQINIIIDYIWSFSDEDLANQIAQDQMDAGSDVIFTVAGPAGNAALLTATQAGAWGIGVDSDQWLTVFESGSVIGSEYLLTSAMKRVDNAVYATIENQVTSTFTSGTVIYDLANDGVGLAPYHEADASIPQPVKDQILSTKQDILDGKIDVWQPCYLYSFLPLIIK